MPSAPVMSATTAIDQTPAFMAVWRGCRRTASLTTEVLLSIVESVCTSRAVTASRTLALPFCRGFTQGIIKDQGAETEKPRSRLKSGWHEAMHWVRESAWGRGLLSAEVVFSASDDDFELVHFGAPHLVPIEPGSGEWLFVLGKCSAGSRPAWRPQLLSVARVDKPVLWARYAEVRTRIEREVAAGGLTSDVERWLWHGTSSHAPEVIISDRVGFDPRFGNVGMWGRAAYFAEEASYSDGYAHKLSGGVVRQIILARVAVGRAYDCASVCATRHRPLDQPLALLGLAGCILVTVLPLPTHSFDGSRVPAVHSQDGSIRRPPDDYHAVTGVTGSTRVYMLYETETRAYPAYVVTYRGP